MAKYTTDMSNKGTRPKPKPGAKPPVRVTIKAPKGSQRKGK